MSEEKNEGKGDGKPAIEWQQVDELNVRARVPGGWLWKNYEWIDNNDRRTLRIQMAFVPSTR